MYIILKNIHPLATVESLESYLQPFLKGSFFRPQIELRAIKIIRLKDRSKTLTERHALIRVCSEKSAKRLIKILNKQTYVDEQNTRQPVRAAEFHVRHSGLESRNGAGEQERRRSGVRFVSIAEKTF